MSVPLSSEKTWLSLKKAADWLGVHPTTLRRWADNGNIPIMLTPGGHRRFALSDLQQLSETQRLSRHEASIESLWAEQALNHTRQHLRESEDQTWLKSYDETERDQHRLLGRQLMGLTLQYVSSSEENPHILTQARHLGSEYGYRAKTSGLPLTKALQASMFFRDTMLEVALQLPESTRIKSEANLKLMRRITQLLNTVHLAIAEVYEITSLPSTSDHLFDT